MKGPKKDMVILSEQGVVTEEAMLAYLHNELSPEEKQQMEKLLAEDPFAADAMEGLKSSANQSAVAVSISSLRKKVRERSGLKERKKLQIHWVTFAWAAVLIGLLLGIGFIMINFLNRGAHTDNAIALKEKNEVANTPVLRPVDSSSMIAEKTKVSDSLTATTTITPGSTQPGNSSDTTSKREVVPNGSLAVTSGNSAPTGGYAYTVNSTVTAGLNDNGRAANSRNMQTTKTDSVHVSSGFLQYSQSAKSEAAGTGGTVAAQDYGTLLNDAMKNFNSGDYNAAGDDFDKILKGDPENADALYFGGISDYIDGKTSKSENSFDKLLKKGNKYIEGSKWYKANILLKKGKSDAAKSLLQDLSNGNSSYKERAIKKLAEMGF